MNKFTKDDLKRFRAESLHDKEQRTLANVSEWYTFWNDEVYVSFSGGKDSTVLADICGFWCSAVGATLYLVFVNTGLEYPEIQKHVKTFAEYLRQKYRIDVVLDILRPEMRFDEVIKKYGYPLISKEVSQNIYEGRGKPSTRAYRKFLDDSDIANRCGGQYSLAKWKPLLDSDIPIAHHCCHVMKKKPVKKYEKLTGRKPLIATLAEESRMRTTAWLKHGCNAFNNARPLSVPMSFWTEQDVLLYIKENNLPLASVYGDIEYVNEPEQIRFGDLGFECPGHEELRTTGCQRTGCVFCAFGCHLDDSPSRFERLKQTHPRQYEYCIGGGEYNEDGIWQPNKDGLGMGHVFDELNNIYGEGFIRY